jgi:hypothetical protein
MALKSTTPSEMAIKPNEHEAARMFERGVAAARGGQRRVAAVLLARTVQLDPGHEMGWLWLSGVLDDPREIAFCLRSALALNPANERARKGLAWLEERKLLNAQPAPADDHAPPAESSPAEQLVPQPPQPLNGAGAAPERPEWRRWPAQLVSRVVRPAAHDHEAVYHGESWWVNWRRSRRAMGRARLVLWVVPVLLLALTLALNTVMRGAVERNVALAQEAVARMAVTPVPTALPAAEPAALLQAELPPSQDARVLAYLSTIEQPRAAMRDAIQSYRNATSQPGGSSTSHAAAARRLRDQVDSCLAAFERLTPPPALAQAHAEYLAGLAKERAALDEILAFYGSFRVELANRAALQMEDAATHLERARAAFDEQRAAVEDRQLHPHSVR